MLMSPTETLGGLFIYRNLKGGDNPNGQPRGWFSPFQDKGGFSLADDKKNIPNTGEVNEPAKTEAPAEEDAPKAVVPPAAKKAPVPGAEQPAPPKEDRPQSGKMDQQVTIPGMGDPAPVGKVVDFAAARDGTAKGKPQEKGTDPPTL